MREGRGGQGVMTGRYACEMCAGGQIGSYDSCVETGVETLALKLVLQLVLKLVLKLAKTLDLAAALAPAHPSRGNVSRASACSSDCHRPFTSLGGGGGGREGDTGDRRGGRRGVDGGTMREGVKKRGGRLGGGSERLGCGGMG